jgi:methylisocitrate lyase
MSRANLRELLVRDDVIYAPGAWDGLSALLARQAGFDAVCAGGFAIAASLGFPDAELHSLTENVDAVRRMADVAELAVIADADTGYGNAVNVVRTVRELEAAGAAAMFMEDQQSPKRCPLSILGLPPLISLEEAVGKLKAAVDARKSEDFLVIARTDARGPDAMARAVAYAEAGADLIMPVTKSFDSAEELARCHAACGRPLMLTLTPSGWVEREFTTREKVLAVGAKIAMFPIQPLYAAVTAMQRLLAELNRSPSGPTAGAGHITHQEFSDLIGFPALAELEAKYLPGVR